MWSSSLNTGLQGDEFTKDFVSSELDTTVHRLEEQATLRGTFSEGTDVKHEADDQGYEEDSATGSADLRNVKGYWEACQAMLNSLWEWSKDVKNLPTMHEALYLAHTHFVANQASLANEAGLRVHVEPTRVVEVSTTTGVAAEADKGSNKKRNKAPKAVGVSKKSKGSSNKPRPTELLRTAFRKIIAGVDEIPALLKSRNVIIAKMTKEALQDILAKALSGVELPMELAQMPEAEIIDDVLRKTFPNRA